MGTLEQWASLIGGLFLLIISGDFLVRGSVAIAKKFKLSPMVVGLTIVAFGTSAPELIVSINAAISGHPEIALGNVIGSNIANIALVLGLTTCFIVIPVKSTHLLRDWSMMFVASMLFIAFLYGGKIGRTEGAILVLGLVGFIVYSIKNSDPSSSESGHETEKALKLPLAIAFIITSSAGLAFGADLLVKGASEIALQMGVSERVISITIIAFGTSVPELVASIIAAIRKQTDISIGNIIGSNLFNILAVIGITSSIHPIEADFSIFVSDFVWMVAISLALLILVQPAKKPFMKNAELNRTGGFILLGLYLVYVIILF